MTNPMIIIHNAETGEIIEREMNADELAQWESDKAAELAKVEAIAQAEAERLAAEEQARLDAEAKAVAKATILAKLGLTEEEINTFLD